MSQALFSVFDRLRITRRAGLSAVLAAAAAFSMTMAAPVSAEDKTTVKVGIMSGEDEDVWRVVVAEAEKKGLTVEVVTFNDYTQPNEALERGEIDANAFQHGPYLENQIQAHGYKIVVAGYTAVWPIGVYSKKHAAIADIPEGAVIGVTDAESVLREYPELLRRQGKPVPPTLPIGGSMAYRACPPS